MSLLYNIRSIGPLPLVPPRTFTECSSFLDSQRFSPAFLSIRCCKGKNAMGDSEQQVSGDSIRHRSFN